MSPTLDQLFPRPVLVMLAGEPYSVSELTLGDLATLQAWLRAAAPRPGSDLMPAPLDPDPETRPARLRSAWRAAKDWPPRLGTDHDAEWLVSTEGRAVFLVLALGRHHPDLTAETAMALVDRMVAADWTALNRVVWAIPPWRELAGELDPVWLARQVAGASTETDWGELVTTAMDRGGFGFAELESWTPTQLRLYASGGRLPEYRSAPADGESREQFEARMIATFSGPELA